MIMQQLQLQHLGVERGGGGGGGGGANVTHTDRFMTITKSQQITVKTNHAQPCHELNKLAPSNK